MKKLVSVVIAVITVGCMLVLYDSEFHYANTEQGRQKAVTEFVRVDSENPVHGIEKGSDLRVIAHETVGKRLFIFFAADNKARVHGVIHLVRGLNGKYRTINSSMRPFPYTAGVYGESLWLSDKEAYPVLLGGDGCDEIPAFQVSYSYYLDMENHVSEPVTYEAPGPDFLMVLDSGDIAEDIGLDGEKNWSFRPWDIRFLDAEGTDVTESFRDASITESWGSGTGTAKRGLVYVWMAITAWVGFTIAWYYWSLKGEK